MKRLLSGIKSLWHKQSEPVQKPLFLPVAVPLEQVQKSCNEGVRRLAMQSEKINNLSQQLEAAMAEMKAIATEVNRDWRAVQLLNSPNQIPPSLCHYDVRQVPQVQRLANGTFVLNYRSVDLFRAEREAASIAQTLRSRHRQKLRLVKG